MCVTDLLSELGKFDLEGTLGLLFVLQLLVESLRLVCQLLLLVVGIDLGPVLLRQALLSSQQHNQGRGNTLSQRNPYEHANLKHTLSMLDSRSFSKVPTYMYCTYIHYYQCKLLLSTQVSPTTNVLYA